MPTTIATIAFDPDKHHLVELSAAPIDPRYPVHFAAVAVAGVMMTPVTDENNNPVLDENNNPIGYWQHENGASCAAAPVKVCNILKPPVLFASLVHDRTSPPEMSQTPNAEGKWFAEFYCAEAVTATVAIIV